MTFMGKLDSAVLKKFIENIKIRKECNYNNQTNIFLNTKDIILIWNLVRARVKINNINIVENKRENYE